MIAVIMAGGAGSRLRPLTCDRPKPLVQICNRPVLAYTLDLLAEHGVQEVYFTLGYRAESVQHRFGSQYKGMRLHYRIEEQPLGTAGGVAALRDHLDQTFLVVSGDSLTDLSLSDLLQFHRERGALATLGLYRVSSPLAYGVVLTDRTGRIRRFLEKPGWGEVFSDTVNTGIYVLEPSVLAGVPSSRSYDFSQHLFPALLQAGAPLYGMVAEGYWCDVGETESYLQANLDLLAGRLRFQPPGRQVAPGVWIEGEPPSGSTVEGPTLIGPGCLLAPGVALEGGVVLGAGTQVGSGTLLRRTVTGEGVQIGADALLVEAVVCDQAQIGERSTLYAGAVVGPGARLGADVTVASGVRVWEGVQVAAATRVDLTLAAPTRLEGPLLRNGALEGRPGSSLSPEVTLRLGMAFGAVLEGAGAVVVGTDPCPNAKLITQMLICGAQAVGRPVLEVGPTAPPVTAFAVVEWAATGGLHVCSDGQRVRILLFDHLGRRVDRRLQSRLEQRLARQEFPLVEGGRTGTLQRLPQVEERYLTWLSGQSGVGYPQPTLVQLEVRGGRWPILERWLPAATFAAVRLPIQIDPLGATWELEGASPVQMLALQLLLHGRLLGSEGVLPVPVQAPPGLERWLKAKGYATVRVRQADWHLIDPLLSLATLVGWMEEEGLTLTGLLSALPVFHTAEMVIDCPWEAKGRIMRALLEEHAEEMLELLDGLRVCLPTGSALLWPDPDEPVYRILAEGEEAGGARELAAQYAARLQALLRA